MNLPHLKNTDTAKHEFEFKRAYGRFVVFVQTTNNTADCGKKSMVLYKTIALEDQIE